MTTKERIEANLKYLQSLRDKYKINICRDCRTNNDIEGCFCRARRQMYGLMTSTDAQEPPTREQMLEAFDDWQKRWKERIRRDTDKLTVTEIMRRAEILRTLIPTYTSTRLKPGEWCLIDMERIQQKVNDIGLKCFKDEYQGAYFRQHSIDNEQAQYDLIKPGESEPCEQCGGTHYVTTRGRKMIVIDCPHCRPKPPTAEVCQDCGVWLRWNAHAYYCPNFADTQR